MVSYLAITKGNKNTKITLFKCQINAKNMLQRQGNFSEITSHFKEIQGIFRAKSKKFELCVVGNTEHSGDNTLGTRLSPVGWVLGTVSQVLWYCGKLKPEITVKQCKAGPKTSSLLIYLPGNAVL